jgi:hypothetical protein
MRGLAADRHHAAAAQRAAVSRPPQPTAQWSTAMVLGVALRIALVTAGCSRTRPPSSGPVDTDPFSCGRWGCCGLAASSGTGDT